MKTLSRIVSTACFLGLALGATTALAASFFPFTPGGNVCESCKEPGLDTIKLNGGQTVKAKITHKNSDFYVARLHGEVRAVPKGDVSEITWANGNEPAGLTNGGQVVLKNGTVLSGRVQVDGKKYTVRIDGVKNPVIAFENAIAEVYIGGSKR